MMVLLTSRPIHVSYSECDVQWGKVSNKEEVDTTRKFLSQRLSQRGAVTFQGLPLAPLDSGPGGRRWGCSLHKESITQPFSQDPLKCWHHSSALLYFSLCRNVLLIKSPLVEQTDSSPIAVGHTPEIHNQQTLFIQIIPRTCKLRAMSITGKRQPSGVQSENSPGSYPSNTVQLRTELHLPRTCSGHLLPENLTPHEN